MRDERRHRHTERPGFRVTICRATGVISSFVRAGKELLSDVPRLNVWRAPTENDLGGWRGRMIDQWLAAGYDRLQFDVRRVMVERMTPQAVRVKVDFRGARRWQLGRVQVQLCLHRVRQRRCAD